MFNTKCGCPDCKKGVTAPNTRAGWKSKSNQYGRIYGSHSKGTHRRGKYRKV